MLSQLMFFTNDDFLYSDKLTSFLSELNRPQCSMPAKPTALLRETPLPVE